MPVRKKTRGGRAAAKGRRWQRPQRHGGGAVNEPTRSWAGDARQGTDPGTSPSIAHPSEPNRPSAARRDNPLLPNGGTACSGKLKVVLCNHSLWSAFHRQHTEMILTRPGRAMFPFLACQIHGMDPQARYRVYVDFLPVDQHHWRYHNARWAPVQQQQEDNMPGNQFYLHPDSPNTGAHWMKREIAFKKLKLTNAEPTAKNATRPILLQSLRKYRPRLHIEELGDGDQETLAASSVTHIFTFPETEFIAVTAYHSAAIIRLKIEHNPFARAFRKESPSEGGLDADPPLGEAGAHTSAEAAWDHAGQRPLLGEGTRQDQDQAIAIPGQGLQAPQPLSAQAAAIAPSFLPSTSAAAMPYEARQDATGWSGMEGPGSLAQTSPEDSMDRLQSGPPKPLEPAPGAQEQQRLHEEIWTGGTQTASEDAAPGERAPKDRWLSPRASGSHARANREARDRWLPAVQASANSSPEAASEDSGYLLVPKEAPGQEENDAISFPCCALQQPHPPWYPVFDPIPSSSNSNSLATMQVVAVNPALQTSPCPLAASYDPSPEGLLALLQTAAFLSESSPGTRADCRPCVPPHPVAGAQEEPSLPEPTWPHLSQTEWEDAALAERAPKKRRVSPGASGSQAMCSGSDNREAQGLRLPAGASSPYTFSGAASEDCGNLLGLPQATAPDSRCGTPVPWNAPQQPQPPLYSLFHSTPSSSNSSNLPSLEVVATEPARQPSTSPLAVPRENRHEEAALFSLLENLEAAGCLSETSQGTGSDCLHSVPPKPMDPFPAAQEAQSLQQEIWTCRSESVSGDSPPAPRASEKTPFSPKDYYSGQDSSFPSPHFHWDFLF